MNIITKELDLFEVEKKYVLSHCISLDCAMGKGIAKEFDKRYPAMKPFVLNKVREDNINQPTAIRYKAKDGRDIYNLITKRRYWGKPTYETLGNSLVELKNQLVQNNVRNLAIPKLGCGLDKLDWYHVKRLIKDIFRDTNINILICELPTESKGGI